MAVNFNSGKKKAKNTELRNKVCAGVGLIAIICIVILGVIDSMNRAAQEKVNTLYDTTVIDYEAYSSELSTLVTIYSIWDEASYQYALNNAKVSSSLYTELFPSEHYTGTQYTYKPSVCLTDIQYSLEPSIDNTRTYYCVMEVTNRDNGMINLYNIIATMQDDVILDYRVV